MCPYDGWACSTEVHTSRWELLNPVREFFSVWGLNLHKGRVIALWAACYEALCFFCVFLLFLSFSLLGVCWTSDGLWKLEVSSHHGELPSPMHLFCAQGNIWLGRACQALWIFHKLETGSWRSMLNLFPEQGVLEGSIDCKNWRFEVKSIYKQLAHSHQWILSNNNRCCVVVLVMLQSMLRQPLRGVQEVKILAHMVRTKLTSSTVTDCSSNP